MGIVEFIALDRIIFVKLLEIVLKIIKVLELRWEFQVKPKFLII